MSPDSWIVGPDTPPYLSSYYGAAWRRDRKRRGWRLLNGTNDEVEFVPDGTVSRPPNWVLALKPKAPAAVSDEGERLAS